MREMKDSGVEWIGEIPVDWKLSKIKHHFSISSGTTPKSDEPEYWDGDIVWITPADFKTDDVFVSKGHRNLSLEGYMVSSLQLVPAGNIIFSKRAPIGQVVINAIDLCTNQGCLAVVLNDDSDVRFYRYVMSIATEEFELAGSGTTFKEISATSFGNILLPLTSKQEQTKCADYLDVKCSKIDVIIEKQQAIIEKLKEYKLSTITEVVTSGLNQKREMKDSHVLSIGRIPTNWDVTKLKYLFGNGDDGLKIGPFGSAIKGKTLESGLYKIYNQAHLINNDFSLNRHYVSEDTFNDLKAYEVKPGDVLFSMMGTIGKCQIMPKGYPKGIMDSHLLKARLNEKVIPEFFIYAYDKDFSNQVIQQLLYTSNGTIMNGLNSTILKNVYIALPPLEEQEEIVEFLNKFTKNIDDRIGVKTKIVEKLQEYKKSLIYEVVTGKKEV